MPALGEQQGIIGLLELEEHIEGAVAPGVPNPMAFPVEPGLEIVARLRCARLRNDDTLVIVMKDEQRAHCSRLLALVDLWHRS